MLPPSSQAASLQCSLGHSPTRFAPSLLTSRIVRGCVHRLTWAAEVNAGLLQVSTTYTVDSIRLSIHTAKTLFSYSSKATVPACGYLQKLSGCRSLPFCKLVDFQMHRSSKISNLANLQVSGAPQICAHACPQSEELCRSLLIWSCTILQSTVL